VDRRSAQRRNQYKALHGLTRTLVANMVTGVTDGWSKELEIIGVGYRCATAGPGAIDLQLGFSHPVHFTAPEGVTFEVPAPTRVIVKGADKEVVGQVRRQHPQASQTRALQGQGRALLGERVARKAGKAAK